MSRYHIPIAFLPEQAGVVFDNATSSPYEASLSTYSFTHRVGSASNRALVVSVAIFAAGSVSSITYNGVALSFVRADSNGVYRTEWWQLVAPATGSNTVQVDLSTSLTSIAEALSYSNVDQISPVDASGGANGVGGTASASATTITVKDRVLAVIATATTTALIDGTSQVRRALASGALGSAISTDKGDIDTAGAVSSSWTGLGGLDSWAVTTIALRPVAPTITVTDPPFTLAIVCGRPSNHWITSIVNQ